MRELDPRVRAIGRSIGWISAAYLAVGALGTWLAVRDGLVGRPFGWDLGLAPLPSFIFGLGTALSAPLLMLLALALANLLLWRGGRTARRAAGTIGLLGAGFTIGMLVEPLTWHPGTWGDGPLTAIVLANLLLPPVLVILASRLRAEARSRGRFGLEEANRR